LTGKGAAGADGKPSKAPFWGEGTFKGEGSGGVASFLKTNEFAIGYLDAGHGIKEGLNEVAIANANGKMVKSSTADKSAAALESKTIPAALDADWSAASLLDAPGDNSWPMMTFSYFYIRQDMHAMGESGALVQALVKYMYSTEGQAHLVEFGFVSVPKEIVDKAVAAIETVALAPGVVEWAFETEGTTQKYVGQMDHIFSGKRGNYNSYLLDHVTDDVEAQIESLQTGMQKMASTSDILQLHGSGTTTHRSFFGKSWTSYLSAQRFLFGLRTAPLGQAPGLQSLWVKVPGWRLSTTSALATSRSMLRSTKH
jgi:hypothetical protein